ncbi:DUF4011 domain-containing protein [Azoarcus sp. KH32C]|uniref:DUF4011 domain-containing protein n=1 Tax=Azoarcus sp. KH32C TaxID=748247 RepID=UPI00023866E5|nr:DUF4011 domain-containing protein [Azoarcus sp. KH32C]BAL23679.1 probable DNA/RNA helicase [Azoarcus sp. KH32C]
MNAPMSPEHQEEQQTTTVDDLIFSGDLTLEEALQRLRLRLLDLSGRNRLLNFKHSVGKSLQFAHSNPEAVFARLFATSSGAGSQISPVPEPPSSAWTTVNGRLTKPDPKQFAASLALDTAYELPITNRNVPVATNAGNRIQTLYYAEDLGRHCRKIDREAKLAIEETGANMLYLVFGFLEYPESPTSDKLYRAPLVCLPVRIEKVENGPYATFHIAYTGEELAENLSLREKVLRDFGLRLPEFDEDGTLASYFSAVEEVIEDQPQWRLRRMMSLTLLSFANMLLVRDLDPENWGSADGRHNRLLHHPIVRQVFEGVASVDGAKYGEEYAIDDHKHALLPLIYDADSSQHSALIDVIEGRNLVIEGPPGTGKSQTITNLIAAALHMGKKVLFVSEKLAALEVVKARLSHAGLENFILELHSNKTSKKRVIEDLEKRKRFCPREPDGLDAMLKSLGRKRNELKTYAELLNGIHGNSQNLTVHKVLWKAEKFRKRIGNTAELVQPLAVSPAPSTATEEFRAQYDTLRYVAKNFDEIGSYDSKHPFWGFFPEEIRPGQDLCIHSVLQDFSAKFESFADSMANAAELLGGHNLNMSAESANSLINVLATLAPADPADVAFQLLPKLFTQDDPGAHRSGQVIEDLRTRLLELERLEKTIDQRWLAANDASSEQVAEAQRFDAFVKDLNAGSTPLRKLPQKLETLSRVTDKASAALEELESAARTAGVDFDGTPAAIAKLQLVLSLAVAAPDDVLYLRHEGLRHPHAHAGLKSAAGVLAEIQARRAALNTTLYLDMTPAEAELRAAIVVLREGDKWFRVFQGKWRRAVGLHKQLQRNKEKKVASARLAQLEEVLATLQRKHAWCNNAELRSFAGPSFRDDETPLGPLTTLSGWIDDAVKRLQGAQLSITTFDPVSVDAVRIAQLRNLKASVERAVSELEYFSLVRAQEFSCAAVFEKLRPSESWNRHLAAAQQVIAQGTQYYSAFVESLNVAAILCADALPIVKASHRVPSAIRELDGHEAGAVLLGEYFSGTTTNLETVEGALLYGRQIKNAKLPLAVESVLVSESSPQNYAYLSGLVKSIQGGWDAASEFTRKMQAYGEFRLDDWVGESSTSHSQYVLNLFEKTHTAASNLDLVQDWSQYITQRKEALGHGLQPFVGLLESGELPSSRLPDAFAYRFYASIAESLFRTFPELSRFNGVRHSTVRVEFAELDKQIIKLRGQQVSLKCVGLACPPAGHSGARVADKTEMALLEHLMSLTLPRTPVRQILRRAGKSVQELKPCFMMGPQAVAQFLEPGHLEFDIVVMDEASQLKPEEAIGAIARGKQLVVVGDPKQLPPTAFFSRQNPAGDGDDGGQQTAAEDAESILDVCMGHFHPVRTLRWHYRSRHESLIAFSNHYFYNGKLFVFPSPYPKSKALGLHYIPVPNGIYENQMNKVEALRVVDAIVEHISSRSEDSLGVVTLNIKQRDLIAELWEERRKSIPQAEEFERRWDGEGMGLFFKNLENVQGDERDCILISTTFGKPAGASVVRQNFGPISRQGGWRRLNVLFTRARKSIGMITSMQPEDIIADGSTPEGTKALRNYLEYARSGILPQEIETGLEPDSDFEVSVIDLLESWGYSVTPQLGVAGFRIDIAVRHPRYPSAYLAAVECDGATYHSGVSVRDRDRIRQEILESLGWKGKIWRIWSTDWFRNPLSEAKNLYAFLESLKDSSVPAEFVVEERRELAEPPQDEEPTRAATTVATLDKEEAAINILDEDEENLEVEVGDLVTYCGAGDTENEPITVRITSSQSNFEQGLLASHTPLAQVLMGGMVGDTVVLRVPGKSPQQFIIKTIKRPQAEMSN